MQNFKRVFRALVVPLTVALSFFVTSGVAYADDLPAYRLGVTPTQNNMGEIQPGQAYTGTFKVKNTGSNSFHYRIGFTPYSVDDDYEPVYGEVNSYTEIANWITVSKASGELDAGTSEEISYKVTVPEDAHGGSQSAVIIVEMLNPEADSDSAGVETIQQVGYLVFGNVEGEVTRTAKIIENKIPSILFKGPIAATSIVENTGNVYGNASYILQVFPLFSNEEIYTTEENPELKVVFPETKRFSEVAWEGAPQLGIFKVRQTVKLFDEVSVEEKLVFLCPIWFIVIVVVLIVFVIFWLTGRGRKNRE